jgi:putative phosphoesterase
MIKAGILSDTHLTSVNADFFQAVQQCFADCQVVIHAGDIVDPAVLEVFPDKTVRAVHGNCCILAVHNSLPDQFEFFLGGFKIALAHGHRFGRYAQDIEPSLLAHFPEADCLIYGHTHEPVCRHERGQLIINPGSFQISGRYSAYCTYAVLEAGDELRGRICEFVPR